jgi:hypothetical protein
MPEQQLVSKKDVEQAKALYEYTAANNEEIDLAAGDTVTIEFKVWACLLPCDHPPHPCAMCRLTMAGGLEQTSALVHWVCILEALLSSSRREQTSASDPSLCNGVEFLRE